MSVNPQMSLLMSVDLRADNHKIWDPRANLPDYWADKFFEKPDYDHIEKLCSDKKYYGIYQELSKSNIENISAQIESYYYAQREQLNIDRDPHLHEIMQSVYNFRENIFHTGIVIDNLYAQSCFFALAQCFDELYIDNGQYIRVFDSKPIEGGHNYQWFNNIINRAKDNNSVQYQDAVEHMRQLQWLTDFGQNYNIYPDYMIKTWFNAAYYILRYLLRINIVPNDIKLTLIFDWV